MGFLFAVGAEDFGVVGLAGDLGDVVGLEGAAVGRGAGRKGFGGELGGLVVADFDAGFVLRCVSGGLGRDGGYGLWNMMGQ